MMTDGMMIGMPGMMLGCVIVVLLLIGTAAYLGAKAAR